MYLGKIILFWIGSVGLCPTEPFLKKSSLSLFTTVTLIVPGKIILQENIKVYECNYLMTCDLQCHTSPVKSIMSYRATRVNIAFSSSLFMATTVFQLQSLLVKADNTGLIKLVM